MAYAELHCLSNFTFLRGASKPEELVYKASALGYSALAITDECSMTAVVKAHTAALCGHWHRPSDFAVNDVQGNVIRSYSTGCLCELHPEYMPLNDWQHGCAIISIDEGQAAVQNLRIKDGRVI